MAHISKPTRKIVLVMRHFFHYEWIFEMIHWNSKATTASEKWLNLPQNRRNSLLRASQETLLQIKFAENFCLRMSSKEVKVINITWKTFRE